MIKKIHILWVSLLLGGHALHAQDQVGCTQLLADAREAYQAGMVELVPELLLSCLESGLSGQPRIEAYKLVINAYLFDYLPDEAAGLMSEFLDEYPNYQTTVDDPAEFRQLFDDQQARRADEAAARAEQERERQQAEIEARRLAEEEKLAQRRQRRSGGRTESPRMGFLLGYNSTLTTVTEQFSLGRPGGDEGAFSVASGFRAGAVSAFPLGRSIDLGIELLYSRTGQVYTASPGTFTTYEYRESANRFQVPVSMVLYLNPSDPTRVYLRVGAVTEYLLSASASGVRRYTETGSAVFRDIELESTDVTDERTRINVYGMAGLGVNVPLPRAFIFVEARYLAGLLQANSGDNRFANSDFLWLLYHVESDFRVNHLSLNAGFTWNLK